RPALRVLGDGAFRIDDDHLALAQRLMGVPQRIARLLRPAVDGDRPGAARHPAEDRRVHHAGLGQEPRHPALPVDEHRIEDRGGVGDVVHRDDRSAAARDALGVLRLVPGQVRQWIESRRQRGHPRAALLPLYHLQGPPRDSVADAISEDSCVAVAVNLLVPLKRLTVAKSRLAERADVGTVRSALALAMAMDTVAAALSTPAVSRVLVAAAEPDELSAVRTLGAEIVSDGGQPGLNTGLRHVAEQLRADDPDCVIGALQADLPALRADELAAAIAA